MTSKEAKREIKRMATQIWCAMLPKLDLQPDDCREHAYNLACELYDEFSQLEAERYPEREKGEG